MIEMRSSFLDWFLYRRALRYWRKAAREASRAHLSLLRAQRARARNLRHSLNEVISTADNRLALPMIGSHAFPKPHGTDWAWRPSLWSTSLPVPGRSTVQSKSQLGDEVTLFHDCQHSELTLRQIRNLREADLAPFGLSMDVFNFDGSFLSLVLSLPDAAVQGLQRRHLIRVDTILELEKPLEIFVRLNIMHGPNTEQLVRELPLHEENIAVEFDLAYSNINEKRVERAWIDLIFDNPQMSQVTLRDLTLCRHPRAEL
ncbi:hypothetical protein BXY70_3307 [Roseovarius halotolerans]|uniref:Uncharacterized protein n=1 Tax=Roseovarius halotolerans TaxID=505353 RepID=A0A1X6ZTF4_9RHOB|nr:DUF6478 family protein [Roseovarius halotolerans]RKT27950.1 hypothetical protein BXY70_3307 [Roseovarius halotolerans]SLN59120.1 hypothetical protein ROH8110_03293 [Roseovarius halotolerans]